jgi:beta-fructofuranosidase
MTDFDAIRQRFKQDFQRPTYHFLPPHNWMNDPNGLIQWNGRYHLFYQHNPDAPAWGNIHWGHAVSSDLVHWDDMPVALSPEPGSVDERGVWSGSAVDNDGVVTVLYTGARGRNHEQQTVCMATSHDPDLRTWTKYDNNPILDAPPAEYRGCGFRDPYVWRSHGIWYMVIGAGKPGGSEAVLLYRSSNLLEWEFLYPLYENDARNQYVYECPNFFQMGDRWLLLFSIMEESHIEYVMGDYIGHDFIPLNKQRLDYGVLYAPLTITDMRGRRMMWGWLRETRSPQAQQKAGWSGVQSLPRVLSLREDNTLRMQPAPELNTLRGAHYHAETGIEASNVLSQIRGQAYEFRLRFSYSDDAVFCVHSGDDALCLTYDVRKQTLSLGACTVTVLPDNAPLDVHLYVDSSVIEVLVNERFSMSARFYGTEQFSYRIHSKANSLSLDVWQMRSIW